MRARNSPGTAIAAMMLMMCSPYKNASLVDGCGTILYSNPGASSCTAA